jgi:hypothetical protein
VLAVENVARRVATRPETSSLCRGGALGCVFSLASPERRLLLRRPLVGGGFAARLLVLVAQV